MVAKLSSQDINELGKLMLLRFNEDEVATYQKNVQVFLDLTANFAECDCTDVEPTYVVTEENDGLQNDTGLTMIPSAYFKLEEL
ncbi:hypothetical protein KAR50_08475 [Periweissella fabaria]|uniref:Uncharacterized protein n=1 Tax=Periweissella fabaria TaxID=546157 RepID=A0ABM8Z7M3_9LACO|nr:hypothetical protein [Periweissella fabaria]MCM0597871.1 hypothetical protein [Periweissella fabaria]CAH0417322.1 hypothetical protein WFA24289_01654 [Periweissella fabaria]